MTNPTYTHSDYLRDIAIRDGATNYCTHVDKNGVYGWYDDACACWEVSNTSTGIDIESIRSLSDINRLIAFHEREQALAEAMQTFVDRCDKGEVRSKRTYAQFKALLPQPPQERTDEQ